MEQARAPKIPKEALNVAFGYAAIGLVAHVLLRGFSFDAASTLLYVLGWPIPVALSLAYWTAEALLWSLVPVLLLLSWLARRNARRFSLGCLGFAVLLSIALVR